MRYFSRIRSNVDVGPLLSEILAQDYAWSIHTGRQERIPVQQHTQTITIRAAVQRPDIPINENQESDLTELSPLFPHAIAFMNTFSAELGGQLSRATIVRLKPQSQVYPHVDFGSYYVLRNRYHLVIQSNSGSVLCSGDERVRMQVGELWWFNNKEYHSSFNESDEWRIHYIFDVLPEAYSVLGRNPLTPQLSTAVLQRVI